MKNLHNRRQYIISDSTFETLPGWQNFNVAERFFISHHPDLGFCQVYGAHGGGLAILGYIVDPYHPELDSSDITSKLVNSCSTFDALLRSVYEFSGRYAMLFWNESEVKVIHDPFASRKLFYWLDRNKFLCASDPSLISKYVMLNENKKFGQKEFLESKEFFEKESMWVGDETGYEGVKQLMPNFYLNLVDKSVERYWVEEVQDYSLDEAVKEISEILKGSIEAIVRRGKIMQSVTAGWDSRVLLAASRTVSDRIYYFVNSMNVYRDDHMDIAIPSKMLDDVGVRFNVHRDMPSLREGFFKILNSNVEGARNLPKTLAIQYYYDFHQEKINLNGNGSEVTRCYYGITHLESSRVTSEHIIQSIGFKKAYPYLKREIEDWLITARDVAKEQNISIMDLFYWEQRMGNWGGMFLAEQDIAVEGFMPFNNRKLILIALGVEEKYRCGPNHVLHKKLIENMWRELLRYRINPESLREKARKHVIKVLPVNAKVLIKRLINR